MGENRFQSASRRVVLCALLAAIMAALQAAMSFLPNIEPVSLLVLVYSLTFGRDVFYIIYTFVFVEGLIYGFSMWWFTYLYIWPLWALAVMTLGKNKERSPMLWAVASGAFGLSFGALDALPYLAGGPAAAFARWLSGIPFDLLHCGGNFFLALILEKPLHQLLGTLKDNMK